MTSRKSIDTLNGDTKRATGGKATAWNTVTRSDVEGTEAVRKGGGGRDDCSLPHPNTELARGTSIPLSLSSHLSHTKPPPDIMTSTTTMHTTHQGVRLRVLTYNVWGVFNSKLRLERLKRFAHKIPNYDIIVLQEQFLEEDFILMWNQLPLKIQDTFYYKRFTSSFYGSGCTMISRFPIVQSMFHAFPLQGYPEMVLQGDFYAQKGVALGTVLVPLSFLEGGPEEGEVGGGTRASTHPTPTTNTREVGEGELRTVPSSSSSASFVPVRVYTTHLVAVYTRISQLEDWRTERYLPYRISQAISLAQFVSNTAHPDDPIIIAGDFNCSPGSLELEIMRILLKCWGFHLESGLPRPLPIPPVPQYAAFPPASAAVYRPRPVLSSTNATPLTRYPLQLTGSTSEGRGSTNLLYPSQGATAVGVSSRASSSSSLALHGRRMLPAPASLACPPLPMHCWPQISPTPLSRSHAFYTYAECNPFNASATSYFKLLHLEGDLPVQIDHLFYNSSRWAVESFEDCPDYEAPSTLTEWGAAAAAAAGGEGELHAGRMSSYEPCVVPSCYPGRLDGMVNSSSALFSPSTTTPAAMPSKEDGVDGEGGATTLVSTTTSANSISTPETQEARKSGLFFGTNATATPASFRSGKPTALVVLTREEIVMPTGVSRGRSRGPAARRGMPHPMPTPRSYTSQEVFMDPAHATPGGTHTGYPHPSPPRVYRRGEEGRGDSHRRAPQGTYPPPHPGRRATNSHPSPPPYYSTGSDAREWEEESEEDKPFVLSWEQLQRSRMGLSFPLVAALQMLFTYGVEKFLKTQRRRSARGGGRQKTWYAPGGPSGDGGAWAGRASPLHHALSSSSSPRPMWEPNVDPPPLLGLSSSSPGSALQLPLTARTSGSKSKSFHRLFESSPEQHSPARASRHTLDRARLTARLSEIRQSGGSVFEEAFQDVFVDGGDESNGGAVAFGGTPLEVRSSLVLVTDGGLRSPRLQGSTTLPLDSSMHPPRSGGSSGTAGAAPLPARGGTNEPPDRGGCMEETERCVNPVAPPPRYPSSPVAGLETVFSSSSFSPYYDLQAQQEEEGVEQGGRFPLSDHYGVAIRLRLLPPPRVAPSFPMPFHGRRGRRVSSPYSTSPVSSSSSAPSESFLTEEEWQVVEHVECILRDTATRFRYHFAYLKLFAGITAGVTVMVLLHLLWERRRHRRLLSSMLELLTKAMKASSSADDKTALLPFQEVLKATKTAASAVASVGEQALRTASSAVATPVRAATGVIKERLEQPTPPSVEGCEEKPSRVAWLCGGVGRIAKSTSAAVAHHVWGGATRSTPADPTASLTNPPPASTGGSGSALVPVPPESASLPPLANASLTSAPSRGTARGEAQGMGSPSSRTNPPPSSLPSTPARAPPPSGTPPSSSSLLKVFQLDEMAVHFTPPSGAWTLLILALGPTVSVVSVAVGMLHRLGNAKLFEDQVELVQSVCEDWNERKNWDDKSGGGRGRSSDRTRDKRRRERC